MTSHRVLEGQAKPNLWQELGAPQCAAALAAQAPAVLSESLCADPEAKSRVSVLETALEHLVSSSPLLAPDEHSKQSSKDTSIPPAELLDRADFTDSTVFAIRTTENTKRSYRAGLSSHQGIFGSHAVVGFLLIACLWSLMTMQQTLPTDQAHMAEENDVKTETRNSPSKSCFLPLDSWHHPEGQQHFFPFLQFSSLDSNLRALKTLNLRTSLWMSHLGKWRIEVESKNHKHLVCFCPLDLRSLDC